MTGEEKWRGEEWREVERGGEGTSLSLSFLLFSSRRQFCFPAEQLAMKDLEDAK